MSAPGQDPRSVPPVKLKKAIRYETVVKMSSLQRYLITRMSPCAIPPIYYRQIIATAWLSSSSEARGSGRRRRTRSPTAGRAGWWSPSGSASPSSSGAYTACHESPRPSDCRGRSQVNVITSAIIARYARTGVPSFIFFFLFFFLPSGVYLRSGCSGEVFICRANSLCTLRARTKWVTTHALALIT